MSIFEVVAKPTELQFRLDWMLVLEWVQSTISTFSRVEVKCRVWSWRFWPDFQKTTSDLLLLIFIVQLAAWGFHSLDFMVWKCYQLFWKSYFSPSRAPMLCFKLMEKVEDHKLKYQSKQFHSNSASVMPFILNTVYSTAMEHPQLFSNLVKNNKN